MGRRNTARNPGGGLSSAKDRSRALIQAEHYPGQGLIEHSRTDRFSCGEVLPDQLIRRCCIDRLSVAPEPYRAMFAIAAMAGLRVGEVLGLQKGDIDFDRRLIRVERSAWHGQIQTVKSKASREPVAMSEALAALLKEYLSTWKANPEGFLFLNRRGRLFNATKVVQLGLWPVLDGLKIKRAGMHAFRHCHASLLMEVGANPKVAQKQMRHSDARITLDTYSHVIGDAQRVAVDKVGEILRPNAPKSGETGEWIQ